MEKQINIVGNISYLRKKNNLSQKELASILNKKTSIISSYEIGKATPPLDVLLKLADYFKVSLDSLIHEEIEENKKNNLNVPLKNNNNVPVKDVLDVSKLDFGSEIYQDQAYLQLLLDKIEITKMNILEFCKEKNRIPRLYKYHRTSKSLNFELFKEKHYSFLKEGKTSLSFIDEIYKIAKICLDQITEDLYDNLTIEYDTLSKYYDNPPH